jgi:aspartyl/asparaginyl-tRNA synthetase
MNTNKDGGSTHVEAEMDFIEFDDLLAHLEEIICRVVDKVLTDESASGYIKALNPGFQKPSRPFLRMKCKFCLFVLTGSPNWRT